MIYSPVLTKTDFVRRYNLGEFGNHSPTWQTIGEFTDSGYVGLVHIRNRVAGGPTYFDIPEYNVEDAYFALLERSGGSYYFSGMCPTDCTMIQGEVMRTPRGLYLYFSRVKKPMRASLLEGGQHAFGLYAKMLLQHFMDNNSWEWLNLLLDRYPDHVVEFTTLSKCWGTEPGFNSLFWEVRKY